MKIIYYKDKAGEFRWQVLADNGEIVGASSEGFSSLKIAENNANILGKFLKDNWDGANSEEPKKDK